MANLVSSRVLSRFLPVAEGDVSVYESVRRGEPPMPARHVDLEAQMRRLGKQSALFRDEEEVEEREENEDPDEAFLDSGDNDDDVINNAYTAVAGRLRTPAGVMSPPTQSASGRRSRPGRPLGEAKRQASREKGRLAHDNEDDDDGDVPESLLLGAGKDKPGPSSRPPSSYRPLAAEASAGMSLAENRLSRAEAHWRTMQEQHDLHAVRDMRRARSAAKKTSPSFRTTAHGGGVGGRGGKARVDPRADAMWLYTNAHNLDAFLNEVYRYYVEHGVWSMLLSRIISLLTELFVFSFAMFLSTCIDYSKIPASKSTSEVLIPQCMAKASWWKNAALFFFVIYWLSRLAHCVADTRRLFRMHDFYKHVLGIDDVDIQTVSWVRIVDGLVKVQDANVATAHPRPSARKYLHYKEPQQRLSAESIANRLMRQDNYYVALYNKEVLDFTLPLPFVGSRQFYSKSLEWCIDFCLTNFIFDEQGSIRPFCLEVRNRKALIEALQMRLRFAAIVSIIIAPFNILRFCIMYFFKYYTEFTRNPARASARTFTPYAEWKIREFNELEHLFERRIRQAYPFAKDYLAQFPKDKTDQLCRFIAFVSGAIAAVLTLATLFDPELFLSFQVTPGRTAVFWLTVMVGVFGVAHGSVPDENEVYDPVLHLKEVLVFTHYMPSHWKDRLHSNEVRAEFAALYQMKVVIFLEEILSLIVAPWILWRHGDDRAAARLVDFFREQTVHVEGVGHQCNFAVFGFRKDLNAEDPTAMFLRPLPNGDAADGLREDHLGLKDDKMASSVVNFMSYYSHYTRQPVTRRMRGWQPPPVWPPVMQQQHHDCPQQLHSPTLTEQERRQQQAKSAATHDVPARRQRTATTMTTTTTTAGAAVAKPPPAASSSAMMTATMTSPPQRPAASTLLHHHSSRRRPPVSSSVVHPQQQQSVGEESAAGLTSLMAQDSDLRDFADAPGLLPMESDTDGDEGGERGDGAVAAANGGAGVLGMLYQFSKKQADKGADAIL